MSLGLKEAHGGQPQWAARGQAVTNDRAGIAEQYHINIWLLLYIWALHSLSTSHSRCSASTRIGVCVCATLHYCFCFQLTRIHFNTRSCGVRIENSLTWMGPYWGKGGIDRWPVRIIMLLFKVIRKTLKKPFCRSLCVTFFQYCFSMRKEKRQKRSKKESGISHHTALLWNLVCLSAWCCKWQTPGQRPRWQTVRLENAVAVPDRYYLNLVLHDMQKTNKQKQSTINVIIEKGNEPLQR